MDQEQIVVMLREKYNKMLVTKKEGSKELNISTGSLDELRRRGEIKSRKVLGQVMFDIGEIARFISEA